MCMHNYFDSTYMTIKHKVVVCLMDREKEYRLTYYSPLSWVTKFLNLEIKDTEGISKNKKNKNYTYLRA